jgi:hypothetical protein
VLPGPTLPLRSSARGPWHSPTLAGCPARGASRMRRPDTGAYRAGAGQRRLGPSKEVRGMRLQLRRDGGAVCLRSRQIRRQLEPLVLPPTRRGQRIRLAPALRAAVAFHGPSRGPCGPRSSAPSLRSSRPLGLEVAVGPGPRSERMPARPEARGRLCLVRPERQPSRSQATRGRNEPALVNSEACTAYPGSVPPREELSYLVASMLARTEDGKPPDAATRPAATAAPRQTPAQN